jgi:hypothetical protein
MGIYAWRQNQGAIPNGNGGYRSFVGLKGVSDILGIVPQKCPCALQGVFLAVEVKQPKKKSTAEQAAFLKGIEERGGIALVVHSLEELIDGLEPFL